MKRFVLAAALIAATGALAADQPASQVLSGHFVLYSGDIGDWALPTAKDTKLFLDIDGAAAQKIYTALGKAAETATEDESVTARGKGTISCTFDKSAKPAAAYACSAAYDLKTGKAINSSIE